MTSFMRVSQKLVFHQSKRISAIKRILSVTAVYVCLSSFIYLCIPCYCDACSLALCMWERRRYTIQYWKQRIGKWWDALPLTLWNATAVAFSYVTSTKPAFHKQLGIRLSSYSELTIKFTNVVKTIL